MVKASIEGFLNLHRCWILVGNPFVLAKRQRKSTHGDRINSGVQDALHLRLPLPESVQVLRDGAHGEAHDTREVIGLVQESTPVKTYALMREANGTKTKTNQHRRAV